MAEVLAGQFTITTAGTAIPGPDVPGVVWIKALAGNTGIVYVGNDGTNDVAAGNGFELSPGDPFPFVVRNLQDYYFDAATSGDKVCWIRAG